VLRGLCGAVVERVALVAETVIEYAVCDGGDVFGEVETCGYYEEGEEEEYDRVCIPIGSRQSLLFFFVCLARWKSPMDGYAGVVLKVLPSWLNTQRRTRIAKKLNIQNMNFSVAVSMYGAKVTSNWYRLSWSQRSREEGYSIVTRSRRVTAPRRMMVEMEIESSMSAALPVGLEEGRESCDARRRAKDGVVERCVGRN